MLLTIAISVIVTLWIIFCVALFTYHYIVEVVLDLPVTGQSPCTAHTALKQLIERLLQETLNLPQLQKAQDHPAAPSDDNDRTYEDLLATAIINKVISSCQNNLPSSSAASVSSRISNSSRRKGGKEYFFGEETLDSKWKTTDLETSSVSSLDEWINSDSSLGSRKYVDRVTLTIKQDIEEISQTDSENENEDDDIEYFQSSSLLNDDEQNWFLQKRQFQGTNSPVPVPMLVPNPTTEAKVLIGDREVDDTSDLSDIASEYGDMEAVPKTQSLLVESKTIIGGKNRLQNGSESESSADSGVKEVDRSCYDDSMYISKTDITVDDDNVEDASILSVYSNTEKEAEYTEKYGSLPRTIVKTPTPPSRPSLQKTKAPESILVEGNLNKESEKTEDTDEEEEQRKIKEFTGSYSKREKEKWKHAIEMKNNPYSKENIEERIKRSSSAVSSLFGPDYYARQASLPSGGKSKSVEANEIHSPDGENIHKAVPAMVSQDDDVFVAREVPESDRIVPQLKPQVVSIAEVAEPVTSEVTSDSDVSYINFYDVENSQVYKKSRNGEEVTLLEARPIPEEPPREKSDENANSKSENGKHPSVDEEHIEAVIKEAPRLKEKQIMIRGRVEDRPDFVKAAPSIKQRTLAKPVAPKVLKRFKSETDLLDDSFDKPPTVIARKKDNTLISKIYRDPHVRSFVLSSRHHLPVEEESPSPKPPLRKQQSSDANVFGRSHSLYVVNQKSYNSDDGISLNHERKKSYYSSEEDLLDLSPGKENGVASKTYQIASATNYEVKSSRQSVSSEEGLLSDHSSVYLEKPFNRGSQSITFSSNEDLLSIDGNEKTSKKKDSTLISKIYQDPNVRNFALSSRDYIPVSEKELSRMSKKSYTSEEDLLSNNSGELLGEDERVPSRVRILKSEGTFTPEISLDASKIEVFASAASPKERKEKVSTPERKMASPDPDIDELVKKKIVHNLLGQFTKSQSDLDVIYKSKASPEGWKDADVEEVSVSVKDLKKRFENNDNKSRVISSLTARSVPKQLKEALKN